MEFLTKSQIRERVENYLINYDAKNRFQFQESNDREFIQIGQPVERIVSKYQTFLNIGYKKKFSDDEDKDRKIDERLQKEHDTFLKDKNTRQGIFDIPKEKDFSR